MESSSVAGYIAWPVIGSLALMLICRYTLLTPSLLDGLFNRMGLWALASLLLYRAAPLNSITDPVHQLAVGCMVMATMYFYCITRAWADGADPQTARRRERHCGLVAALVTVVLLIAGRAAGPATEMVDLSRTGPAAIAGLAFAVPIGVNGLMLLRMWIIEFRLGTDRIPVRVVSAGLILANLLVVTLSTISVVQVMAGVRRPDFGPYVWRAEATLVAGTVVTTLLASASMFSVLLIRAGWDRTGRRCRRLLPLWRDLTAAVPEIVLHPDGARDSDARLLRMTVEIRDALLHLGPYLHPEVPRTIGSGRELRCYARGLAEATRVRRAGGPPRPGESRPVLATAPDFDTELRFQLGLARAWSRVRQTAG